MFQVTKETTAYPFAKGKWSQDLFSYSVCAAASTFSLAVFSACFTTMFGAKCLFVSALFAVVTRIFIKYLFSFVEHLAEANNYYLSSERVREAFYFLVPFVSGMFRIEKTAICAIHELGHACAATALFATRPKIRLQLFRGGETRYRAKFPRLRGMNRDFGKMLVLIAGPLASIFFASICFLIKSAYEKARKYSVEKEASRIFSSLASSAVFPELTAAFLALNKNSVGISDYTFLRDHHAVHPAYAIFFIVTIPYMLLQVFGVKEKETVSKPLSPKVSATPSKSLRRNKVAARLS